MSSSARDSLNVLAACLCNGLTEYDEYFTLGVKILADFRYDVNIC